MVVHNHFMVVVVVKVRFILINRTFFLSLFTLPLHLMTSKETYKLPKSKKLKSAKLMNLLFAEGTSIFSNPIRFVFLNNQETHQQNFQVGFSVPKRKIRRAVDRNKIKRLMRESFRLHQHKLQTIDHTAMMWLYTGNQVPDYKLIEEKMLEIIRQFNTTSSK